MKQFFLFLAIIQDSKFQQNDIMQNVLYNIKLLCNGGNLEKLFNEEKDLRTVEEGAETSLQHGVTRFKRLPREP